MNATASCSGSVSNTDAHKDLQVTQEVVDGANVTIADVPAGQSGTFSVTLALGDKVKWHSGGSGSVSGSGAIDNSTGTAAAKVVLRDRTSSGEVETVLATAQPGESGIGYSYTLNSVNDVVTLLPA